MPIMIASRFEFYLFEINTEDVIPMPNPINDIATMLAITSFFLPLPLSAKLSNTFWFKFYSSSFTYFIRILLRMINEPIIKNMVTIKERTVKIEESNMFNI